MSGEWRCLARITRVYINRKYPYIRTARSFLCYLPALNPSLLPSQEATDKTIGDMADIRDSQRYCTAGGDDSRAYAHVAHYRIKYGKASETSEEPQITSFLSVREASEKRPRSQLPCQSRRDGDMRLDHSRRKKLEKSNLRIRFKKVVDVR